MKIDKLCFKDDSWFVQNLECDSSLVSIVFVFGDYESIKNKEHSSLLKKKYPNASIVGSSTAGNILDDELSEYEAVGIAISFDSSRVSVKSGVVSNLSIEKDAKNLMNKLDKDGLKHVFVLAQGLKIDGSKLVSGLNTSTEVTVTGAMAADSFKFEDTCVFYDDASYDGMAIIIGFYGESLHVEVGCKAGWQEFGYTRIVTKSDSNIVYEIDNKPVLELYEKYLGEYIKDLPASGLLFPLSIKTDPSEKNEVIRVMMSINEDKSVSFAGDVPQGSEVRLMKTNIDNLVEGAQLVADSIKKHNDKRSLTLAISCSGRYGVLKQLVNEEIEVLQKTLTDKSQIIGFYSYGEIAPFSNDLYNCKLHNETMTLTTIFENLK